MIFGSANFVKKNYIVLTDCGVSDALYLKYGCDFFFKKGMDVYYIDISSVLNRNIEKVPLSCSGFSLLEIKKYSDILRIALEIPTGVVNLNLSRLGFLQLFIIVLLKLKKSILFSEVISDNLEASAIFKGGESKPWWRLKLCKSTPLSFFLKVKSKLIIEAINNFFKLDFLLAKSVNQAMLYPLYYSGMNVLQGIDWDLEAVLDARPPLEGSSQDCVVFIDQYIPFHPEIIEANLDIFFTDYYENISRFISGLEQNKSVTVYVLPHPQAKVELLECLFPGRCITKQKMLELLPSIKFFLGHFSMGLNYAVASMKPILFITSPGLVLAGFDSAIRRMAVALGQPIVEINSRDCQAKLVHVNCELYSKYLGLNLFGSNVRVHSNWELVFASPPVKNYVNT